MSEFLVEVLNQIPNSPTKWQPTGVYKAKYAYRAAQKSQRKASKGLSQIKVRVTDSKSRQTFYEVSSKEPNSKQKDLGLLRKIVSKKIGDPTLETEIGSETK